MICLIERFKFFYRIFLFFLAFIFHVQIDAHDLSSLLNPTQQIETIAVSDSLSMIRLKYPFMLENDIVISSNHYGLLDSTWFMLTFGQSEVQFLKPLLAGDTLKIYYHALPVPMKAQFQKWEISDSVYLDSVKTFPVAKPMVHDSENDNVYEDNLKRSGSIFRGFSVGSNQGMRLQSGLRLQLSGQIAPNVEVVGSLTDQNTPIQPEGNTQTLQEIDKVFIQVNAPGFQTTMGDYVFDAPNSEFAAFSRKLQGATATIERNQMKFSFLAGASKGEFSSNNFNGIEGSQGPYQLTGSKGQREIIVLAGTERVWIDGVLMTRGENKDYVIEYGNGQITFTRNRLITGDSRITVDFEYSDQKFQKNIYGAVGEMNFWNDKLQLETSFLREADDKDNPLDIPITDEYKEVLSQAGDISDSSIVSGGIYQGENKGEYKKVIDNGKTIYQYVGTESGDYRVRFSYVGSGQGDYSFQGYGIFRYEGEGLGDYLPVIFLPLATAHQVADFKTSLNLSKHFNLNSEVAFSDEDLNLYSGRDDNDNSGTAYKGELNINNVPLGKIGNHLGKFSFNYKGKSVGNDFRPAGRVGEIEHGRKWGSETGVTWGEDSHEMLGHFQMGQWADLQASWGRLQKGDGFTSDRRMLRSQFQKNPNNLIKYQIELIDTENKGQKGYWLRQQSEANVSWKGWKPSFEYEGELQKNESEDSLITGFQFHDWMGKLAFQKWGGSWELSESIRQDQQYNLGELQDYSIAKTDRIAFASRNKRGLTTNLHYTHRFRDYTDRAIQDQNSDLANAEFQWKPRNGFLTSSLNYQFSSTRVSEMVRDTIEVGQGLGNYRFDEDLNEFIPDPDGNLIFRMIQTGEFIPVNELKLNFDVRIKGDRLFSSTRGLKKFLKSINTQTQLRFDRKDKERNFARVNKMAVQPDWGNDTTLVSGFVSLFQDIEYRPKGQVRSVRLRYRHDNTENRQFVNEGQLRKYQEVALRYKDRFAKLGLLFEAKHKIDDKEYYSLNQTDKYVAANEFIFETSYRPNAKLELAVKAEYRNAVDQIPDPASRAQAFFIVPRIVLSFRQKGRLRAELEFGRVTSDPKNRALPYEMLQGDQPGQTIRWTLFATYRISGHVMATLNYRGRNEPWRTRVYQTGQVEVRAFF